MTLGQILNTIVCGVSAVLGTGLKGCRPFFKKVTTVWLTPAGFEYDSTQIFDETYINKLKAEGNLIVIKGIRTFTDNSGDDNIDELEDGTKQVARLGLYEFALAFVNGLYFHAALHSLNSFGNYDVTFIDRDSNILGTKALSGQFKGMTAGMIQGMKFSWATDTQGQREGLSCQLLERTELDEDFILIQGKSLTFNANKIEGVNEIDLSFSSAPASAGTTINVVAKRKQDGAPFVGLPAANWLYKNDGATIAVTGDDSATGGTYVLTVTALVTNEVINLSIFDSTSNDDVVELAGDQYKSNTLSATVI
jgi:hypothetical protein